MKLPLIAAASVCIASFLPVTALAQAAQQDSNLDQRILREVRQILANEHAFDVMSISSSVHHGIVTLDGTVSSQAAKVLASTEIENVDGCQSRNNSERTCGV
jgi:osmotically-inducible protein OsmY